MRRKTENQYNGNIIGKLYFLCVLSGFIFCEIEIMNTPTCKMFIYAVYAEQENCLIEQQCHEIHPS